MSYDPLPPAISWEMLPAVSHPAPGTNSRLDNLLMLLPVLAVVAVLR